MHELIADAVGRGGLPADEALGHLLPLFAQVQSLHERGLVAPLRGIENLQVDERGHVVLDATQAGPPQRPAVSADRPGAVEVVAWRAEQRDLGRGGSTPRPGALPGSAGPHIVAGWQSFEQTLGQHDELTDIADLGLLLTALLCGLDLADPDSAAELEARRRNLFAIRPDLHPVLASLASSMIEPDRTRRAQDLDGIITRLSSYRDLPEDFDLHRVITAPGPGQADGGRRTAVLAHLRERLFDLSRRNPLLHFRPTARSLDLTEASVPLVLDVRTISPAQLFTWTGTTAARLAAGRAVDLASVVRWDDAPYASLALDALISTARRDRAEYGQDQLRLVVAFLHWHDVKNDPHRRISSPLVMAPATLTKQRGVRDSYRLQLAGPQAEINPVLRHQLRELYDIELPVVVDLTDTGALAGLQQSIQDQARRSEPGLSVGLVDRPRIAIVHKTALVRLQTFRRRRSGSRNVARRDYAYSYTRPDYAPLGVQIYRDRVAPRPIPLSVEFGDAPRSRQSVLPSDGVVEQDLYVREQEGVANPYVWDVDLCSVTLANFNYRTLSLIRDYDALLATPRPNSPFDELFADAPRQSTPVVPEIEPADSYQVIAADGSQAAAIAQARIGDNFVIQGPPGTGKSQTIANLVADFVGHGKRVLFVCQKRAALDVVHARLRARGMAELCTLIHDSQQDKKSFVLGLKDTYEKWFADEGPRAAAEFRRDEQLRSMDSALGEIEAYEQALGQPGGPISTHSLVQHLVALRERRWGQRLPAVQARLLPSAGDWWAARARVDTLTDALARAGAPVVLASGPLRLLAGSLWSSLRPDLEVAERSSGAVQAIGELLTALEVAADGRVDASALTIAEVERIEQLRALLGPLAGGGHGAVLDTASDDWAALRADAANQAAAITAAHAATNAAAGWRDMLSRPDAEAALAVATVREPSAWRFLHGDWRTVRRSVEERFHPGNSVVPPTVVATLTTLVGAYAAGAAANAATEQVQQRWGHHDATALAGLLVQVRAETGPVASWRDLLCADHGQAAVQLADLSRLAGPVRAALTGLVDDVDDAPLGTTRTALRSLLTPAGEALVRSTAPALRGLWSDDAGRRVFAALRSFDADADQIEFAVAWAGVEQARAVSPVLAEMDGARLDNLLDLVGESAQRLRTVNAEVITARARERFADAIAISQRSVTGMSDADRALKKTWSAGRRELEHEFGKVQAYKSIRQLSSGDPGAVVAALRPVWLMSPSSVSDTLPLDRQFDVVIYDEASQVPVEEAVPALYRAGQVIVVGDRMQLPPTTYFQAAGTRGADGDADEDARVGVVLDSDSFLAVSSVRLPSTMLRWHYRSRYEALIQFSNAAFYDRELATIPDRTVLRPSEPDLRVSALSDLAPVVDAVLTRSISVIRVDDGVYTARTNPREATVIAGIVRDLLARETGRTVGIVAFSEAQQGEIERALEKLSAADEHFARRYEAELDRESDGQAVGLFVKNLENVQGDERDIILMSVCYAPDPDGRMRMNFGPINNAGGEKRLNVIFSRAREHMVLVSSIDPSSITNLYNDGANTLRNFLRYAEAVSTGDEAGADAVLGSVGGRGALAAQPSGPETDATVGQLAEAMRARGLVVATDVGQSGFRADLALRRAEAEEWSVAVLVDHATRLASDRLLERRLNQPAALRSAGWRVQQVLVTDWQADPDGVADRIAALV